MPGPGITLLYVATVSATIRQFLLPYAAHYRARGWRVEAAAKGVSTDPAVRDAFDAVHELPLSRSILDVRGWIDGQRAIGSLLGSRPDIVHVHTPIASFITRLRVHLLAPADRPAVAYTAHGFHFHRDGRAATNLVFRTAERVAGRWTDRLVVINDEDEAAALRHGIVPRPRLVRMPGIGLDTGYYARTALAPDATAAARRAIGVSDERTPLFVVVAELSRRKRSADVVEALARVDDRDAVVVFAGTGPERQHVEDLARERGVSGRVRFVGFVHDVRPLMAAATAVVLVSDREGLARALMEALSLEVPVIASTARGNGELVTPATGIIVPTGDTAALARAMDWLIDHPAERSEMGRAARPLVVARYDIRVLLRQHDEMYESLLSDSRRSVTGSSTGET